MEYRACYWISDDGQAEVVLTTPEQATLLADDLLAAARREAEDTGLTIDGGTLKIGDWSETVYDVELADAAAALGRRGGQSTSERKAAASRANGQRGGRPRGRQQNTVARPCRSVSPAS